MKSLFLNLVWVFALMTAAPVRGQNAAEQEVAMVVNTLFEGMRKGDSAMVSRLFHKEARMLTSYRNQEGKQVLKEGSLQGFLDAIGTPHPEAWNEKIWNTEVRIDDDLAQVWTDYAFYAGEKFSHCGVDALQLVKGTDGRWLIVNLVDTRRKEPCQEP